MSARWLHDYTGDMMISPADTETMPRHVVRAIYWADYIAARLPADEAEELRAYAREQICRERMATADGR